MIRILLGLLLSSCIFICVVLADDDFNIKSNNIGDGATDQEWFDIANSSLDIAISAIKDKYQELIKLKQKSGQYDPEFDLAVDEYGEVNFSNTMLRIFVSTTMSIELLKYYHKQAKHYGGYLVMNGLPEDSFQGLVSLMYQVCELKPGSSFEGTNCGILVDSEWFNEFEIKSVPSFVLSKSEGVTGSKVTFDKVGGNIGVPRALEIMSDKGDLNQEARKWLGK